MIHVVEVRRIGGDLPDLVAEMRRWLDRRRIEPESFDHSAGGAGLAFRVGFNAEPHATAFAAAFGGRLECDPHGAALWQVMPQTDE